MTSLTGRRWILRTSDPSKGLLERLLELRGIKPAEHTKFLTPNLGEHGHAPELLKDLPRAVERIQKAITNKERIFICGDYDADGVTASALLFKALKFLNAEVSVRLPHRIQDGYGLSRKQIEEAAELGVKLIITVDNGISSLSEVKRANELGIDVIITDHHLPPTELPAAFAIVNPRQADCNYPCEHLAGAGVAYKLALALLKNPPAELKAELLALATIGTIADICPLVGENRALVAAGLRELGQTKNPGLLQIFANSKIPKSAAGSWQLGSQDIGFRVGPRINAAGRIDDALIAWQALTHADGARFADQLENLNLHRRQFAEKMLADAIKRLGKIDTEKILIASSPDWHAGVIGLTAGKLAESFYRPVVLMEERDGQLTGSCRSPIPEFNITAALAELADLLTNFGGHRAAAGFTLAAEKQTEFAKRLREIAERELDKIELSPQLELDLEVGETELTAEFLTELKKLAPFGAENPEPVLFLKSVRIEKPEAIGTEQKHLRLQIGKSKIKAIGFGLGEHTDILKNRPTVDLAAVLEENEWQGRRSLQLRVVDLR